MAKTNSMQNPIDKYFENVTRYHVFFFFIYFTTKFMSVWHTLNIIFLSPPMNYICDETRTRNGSSGSRENKCPCENPLWDHSMFTKTIQTKFGIVCDEKWLISFSESTAFFGLLVGGLVFGVVSDRYGRLNSFAACQFIIGAAGCLVSFTPIIYLFIFVRFFEGIGSGGAIITGFVLCVEFCGTKYRATISSLLHIPANIGLICLAGISYLIRDCDEFQLAISVPVLIFVITKCLLLESPKWLLDNNNKEGAIRVIEKFCRFNKIPYENIRADIEAYLASRTVTEVKKVKFYHIFRYKSHSKNFCCMAYGYFVCGLCYYGVSQYIGKMSPQVHQNTAFNGLLLSAGTIACIFLINRLRRRSFLRSTIFIAGVGMLIVIAMPVNDEYSAITIIIACLASSFFYMSFIIIFLYGVELFPTNIRSSVLGVLTLSSRIGQIIGPQINTLSSTTAGTIYGSLAVIAAALTFFLPETKGTELPSTLEERMFLPSPRVQFKRTDSLERKSDHNEPGPQPRNELTLENSSSSK